MLSLIINEKQKFTVDNEEGFNCYLLENLWFWFEDAFMINKKIQKSKKSFSICSPHILKQHQSVMHPRLFQRFTKDTVS